MMENKNVLKKFGIIGLGKMGAALGLQAIEKNWKVVGMTLGGVPESLVQQGVEPAKEITDFCALLPRPRVIMLYIPAGKDVDSLIDSLAEALEPGDIIVDGG